MINLKEKKFFTMKYDRVFKSIVTDMPEVLNKILNDILNEEVEIIKFLPNELTVKKIRNRTNTLDIIVKTKDSKIINVELNTSFDKVTRERNLLYYASLYSQNSIKGEIKTDEVIQVNLNYGKGLSNKEKEIYLLRSEEGNIYSKSFKIICVNVDKYKEKWYYKNVNGDKEHIYITMLGASKEELDNLCKQDKLIEEVKNKMFILNDDESYTRLISKEEEDKIINTERGRREGDHERLVSVVNGMLKKNIPLKDISEITGLTEEEIKELAK